MTIQINDLDRREAAPVVGRFTVPTEERTQLYRNAGKRSLDIALVLLSAPIVLPVILMLAALVALDGHNPFYLQNRVGKNGRVFKIFKLRSMVPNAKASLKDILAKNSDARAEWEANQKLRHDPRITRLGRIIRNTSLDELPQLLNVLKGDMSLIGPRPMMIEQIPLYPDNCYYAMRPGISGLWQVTDRNASTFAERATYDAEYHRRLSLWLDITILARTFGVVMRGTGC
ncbi:MAG: sugar transferase [Pseudooceanicola sp.]|jgi:lipopolysaccharide/colanic/teichoic acid biosynthesis glycosyltransferase|nr:sugar transferase [Pseudooceanicola sp.]|tara:strand:- start:2567 stop:3256 length:690 start_codon:yes stop_codon:yes gene_type:complete